MAKDKCVVCGSETPYDETTNIMQRYNYVEGSGQLCEKCYNGVYNISCCHDNPGEKGRAGHINPLLVDAGWADKHEGGACCMMDSIVSVDLADNWCSSDEDEFIDISVDMILNTPNDADLGWMIRKLYTDYKG